MAVLQLGTSLDQQLMLLLRNLSLLAVHHSFAFTASSVPGRANLVADASIRFTGCGISYDIGFCFSRWWHLSMASPGWRLSSVDSDCSVLLGTCGLLALVAVFCSTVGGEHVTLPDLALWYCHASQLALSHRCHCLTVQLPCEL